MKKLLIKLFVVIGVALILFFGVVLFGGQHFCIGNTDICFTSEG